MSEVVTWHSNGVRFALWRLLPDDAHCILKRRTHNGPGYDTADSTWDALDVFHLDDGESLDDLAASIRERMAQGAY